MRGKGELTVSEQRRKLDWLRSELQKPAVMKNPQRVARLEAALAEARDVLRALQAQGR
jgi:hypothetical protein